MSCHPSSQRFPSSHRLLRSDEFDLVFSQNEVRHSTSSLLFLAKPNQQGFNRLGMVIGKKNVPLAVDRNRIKRQIRESFRRLPDVTGTGMDIVVLARPGARQDRNLRDLLNQGFNKVVNQGGTQ